MISTRRSVIEALTVQVAAQQAEPGRLAVEGGDGEEVCAGAGERAEGADDAAQRHLLELRRRVRLVRVDVAQRVQEERRQVDVDGELVRGQGEGDLLVDADDAEARLGQVRDVVDVGQHDDDDVAAWTVSGAAQETEDGPQMTTMLKT
jgi:hypothetical protein